MFGLFKKKSETHKLNEEIHRSFEAVKQDFSKVGQWISHFDIKHEMQKSELQDIKKQIFVIQNELDEIKDFISLFGSKISKQQQTTGAKQQGVVDAQTAVQTAVQTNVLENLTVMERAIVWAMLNTDQKLSYEDIATLMNKDKSTIRGQINTIRQKTEGLILEKRELNGKKRLYIPAEMKQIMLKSAKVRVKTDKKRKKRLKMSEKVRENRRVNLELKSENNREKIIIKNNAKKRVF